MASESTPPDVRTQLATPMYHRGAVRLGNPGTLVIALGMALGSTPTLAASEPCGSPLVSHDAFAVHADRLADVLTIASLNLAGQVKVGDVLPAWMQRRAIDVLLLQEVGRAGDDGAPFVAALSARLGFHFAYARDSGVDGQGLAIVSRYPLADVSVRPLKYHRLRFKSRCRIALAATAAATEDGTSLRLVNVHLDTRINSRSRVTQLEPVLEAFDGFEGPQIIGGDFNTMNVRWFRTMWPLPFLQHQTAAVRALLESVGFRTPLHRAPPTFRVLGLPLKLDWLYLKRLEPMEWGVDQLRFTDHRGVWLRVGSRPGVVSSSPPP
jgi:endonuclease/exonuclease/phosphatase (EEP) superfamily protein YafD